MGVVRVQAIIKKAASEGRNSLLEPEAKTACLAYGIPTPRFEIGSSPQEAKSHAEARLPCCAQDHFT